MERMRKKEMGVPKGKEMNGNREVRRQEAVNDENYRNKERRKIVKRQKKRN